MQSLKLQMLLLLGYTREKPLNSVLSNTGHAAQYTANQRVGLDALLVLTKWKVSDRCTIMCVKVQGIFLAARVVFYTLSSPAIFIEEAFSTVASLSVHFRCPHHLTEEKSVLLYLAEPLLISLWASLISLARKMQEATRKMKKKKVEEMSKSDYWWPLCS